MDSQVPDEWVGHQVIVRLTSSDMQGAELLATLKEKNEDGIILSEIGELGPGPTMFCPWNSVRDVRLQPLVGRPSDEGRETGVLPYDDLDEIMAFPGRVQRTSALTLERVVPIVQREEVNGVTIVLSSAEVHAGGNVLLRFMVSFGDTWYANTPELEGIMRDSSGHLYECIFDILTSSGGDAEVTMQVGGLPDNGGLEVEIVRVVELDGHHKLEAWFCKGPWTFRFSL